MPDPATVLSWSTLTPAVNEMKDPNSFVKNMFFGAEQTVPTRLLEIDFMVRGRKIAPFVQRDGQAIMVDGYTENFRSLTPAHIRIKKAMTPSDLLNKRRAGTVIFPDAAQQANALRRYIATELKLLGDDVTNSEEYLACMALRGAISYTSADDVAFTVTFPRSSANDDALSGGARWDQSTANMRKNFMDVAAIINDAVQLNVTDVILGADAADAFLADAGGQLTGAGGWFDARRLETGTIDLTNQFLQSGAMYLGAFVHGIRVWRYARQVAVGSSSVDLIRPKFAEFVCRTPAAQMVTYYGAIEDMKAIGPGRVLQSKRFSKSWEEEDPSARMLLLESNPLPVPRRPDATMSLQVLT